VSLGVSVTKYWKHALLNSWLCKQMKILNGVQTPAQFKQQGLFFDTMLYTHIFSESFFCFPVT
jgi:hypothetical protein